MKERFGGRKGSLPAPLRWLAWVVRAILGTPARAVRGTARRVAGDVDNAAIVNHDVGPLPARAGDRLISSPLRLVPDDARSDRPKAQLSSPVGGAMTVNCCSCGAPLTLVEMAPFQKILHVLANPNLAYLPGGEVRLRAKGLANIVAETVPGCAITYADGAGPDKRCYRVSCDKIERTLPENVRKNTLKLLARSYCEVQHPGDVRAYLDGFAGRLLRLLGLVERRVARAADVTLGASPDLVTRALSLGARDARFAPVAATCSEPRTFSIFCRSRCSE